MMVIYIIWIDNDVKYIGKFRQLPQYENISVYIRQGGNKSKQILSNCY